ncbi:MAG: hypothetical protein DMG35_07265 [Acidobacteria bacterium]|nr:MAG: hypothetical protein DMG35_07265 [Acidobacteriota bacterium]
MPFMSEPPLEFLAAYLAHTLGMLRKCWQANLVMDLKQFANPVLTGLLTQENTLVSAFHDGGSGKA